MIAHRLRNGNATRCANTFESCRDVNAIAVDIVAIDDHVAEIHADSKLDAPVIGGRRGALADLSLHLNRAGDGVHDARKFCKHAIAGKFDDATLVRRDLGVDQLAANLLQLRKRAGFVGAH